MGKIRLTILLSTIGFVLAAFSFSESKNAGWDEHSKLSAVLISLGEERSEHYVEPVPELVEKGRQIVTLGHIIKPSGRKGKQQSKHYVCTHCHNIEQEDPDLSLSDPETRLEYARRNNLPFLQGTTLYGTVNKNSWYNGDYEKKYGDLVKPAKHDLTEAIQLCAKECSQGRKLNKKEMQAVLAYLWSLEYTLGDLNLSIDEFTQLNDGVESDAALEILKSKYLDYSPATFVDPPNNRSEGLTYKGNPDNGKAIYDLSCMHCHSANGVTNYILDDSKLTFQHLERHFTKYSHYSVYQVSRYGTSPQYGYKPYMPNYTLERMSHEQLEDLRAYIEQQAQ